MLGDKQGSEVLTHERKHLPVSMIEAGWLKLDRTLKSTAKIRITQQLKLEGSPGRDLVQTGLPRAG